MSQLLSALRRVKIELAASPLLILQTFNLLWVNVCSSCNDEAVVAQQFTIRKSYCFLFRVDAVNARKNVANLPRQVLPARPHKVAHTIKMKRNEEKAGLIIVLVRAVH